jgi:hypothetical protein
VCLASLASLVSRLVCKPSPREATNEDVIKKNCRSDRESNSREFSIWMAHSKVGVKGRNGGKAHTKLRRQLLLVLSLCGDVTGSCLIRLGLGWQMHWALAQFAARNAGAASEDATLNSVNFQFLRLPSTCIPHQPPCREIVGCFPSSYVIEIALILSNTTKYETLLACVLRSTMYGVGKLDWRAFRGLMPAKNEIQMSPNYRRWSGQKLLPHLPIWGSWILHRCERIDFC